MNGFIEFVKDAELDEFCAITADTLEVTFNKAADVENVKLAVTRGTSDVTGSSKWNIDNTVATFKADGKLRTGTYTVTATSKADADFKAEGSVEVSDQKTAEIVISNDVALTGEDNEGKKKIAYAYYDVLDQYGESIRNTTNITWTTSASKARANRTTGEIELTKGEEFVFGEKIYLTGVDTKNGISIQKELTVGQPKSLNTLEVAGFVKKGTTNLVESIPAGFKSGEYYMVFEALDQNGDAYHSNKIKQDDATFISDNPLVIKGLKHDADAPDVKTVVVDGIEYAAMLVEPGMNADKGGEVNLRAIANKTGQETVKNVVIGDLAILTDFDLLQPAGVVAEGELVEVPFEAYDQNGEKITNFTTLAREAGINKLSLTAPEAGSLTLKENNDGTASLTYQIAVSGWVDSKSTDGVDRPVSLTSVVVGGNASNLMLSVSDKAHPVGIKEVNFENVLVKGGDTTIALNADKENNNFLFVDQYGREMNEVKAHEFFSHGSHVGGQDFDGYNFYVRATYKGEAGLYEKVYSDPVENSAEFDLKTDGTNLKLAAKEAIDGPAKTGMALQFEIVKYKNATEGVLGVSPAKTESLSIVDIDSVKNFEVKELPRLQVETTQSSLPTGAGIVNPSTSFDANADLSTKAKAKDVEVTGDYNGQDVTIPGAYLKFDSVKLDINETTGVLQGVKSFVAGTEATVTPAKAAKKTIGGVDFEAVTPGVAGDAITVEIVQGDAATDADTTTAQGVAVVGKAITITLGTEWDATLNEGAGGSKSLSMDVDAVKTLISNNTDATALVKVTNSGAADVTVAGSTNLTGGVDENETSAAVPGQDGFKWSDFYDVTTANFLRKDAEATITAKVHNTTDTASQDDDTLINTAKRSVLLSDAQAVATTIKGADEITVNPNVTVLTADVLRKYSSTDSYVVLDQYGEEIGTTADIALKAINVVENKEGYVANNFKVTKNDTPDLKITGAERGDTFTLELRAGNAKKTVKVTVGADEKAKVTDQKNHYLEELIGKENDKGLEDQRLNSLK